MTLWTQVTWKLHAGIGTLAVAASTASHCEVLPGTQHRTEAKLSNIHRTWFSQWGAPSGRQARHLISCPTGQAEAGAGRGCNSIMRLSFSWLIPTSHFNLIEACLASQFLVLFEGIRVGLSRAVIASYRSRPAVLPQPTVMPWNKTTLSIAQPPKREPIKPFLHSLFGLPLSHRICNALHRTGFLLHLQGQEQKKPLWNQAQRTLQPLSHSWSPALKNSIPSLPAGCCKWAVISPVMATDSVPGSDASTAAGLGKYAGGGEGVDTSQQAGKTS